MEIEELLDALDTLYSLSRGVSNGMSTAISLIFVIVAIFNLIQCFFGLKLFKLMTTIVGGFVGFLLGILVGLILGSVGSGLRILLPVFTVAFTLAGGYIAFKVYKIGVFIYTGFLPAIIFMLLARSPVAGIIAYIIFGILGVLLARPYIIVITAIPSGLAAGSAIMGVFHIYNPAAGLLVGIVLAIVGFLYQWNTTKSISHKPAQFNPQAQEYSPQSSSTGEAHDPSHTSNLNFSYAFNYITKKSLETTLVFLIIYIVFCCFPTLPIYLLQRLDRFSFIPLIVAVAIFIAGAVNKVPTGADGKLSKDTTIIKFSGNPYVYMFKRPRPLYILIGIVLILLYNLVLRQFAAWSYSMNFLINFSAVLFSNVVNVVGYCFIVGSFMYIVNNPEVSNSISSASATTHCDPDLAQYQHDIDNLKSKAETSTNSIPQNLNGSSLIGFFKNIHLNNYHFVFNKPKMPFLIVGLTLILVGTVFNVNALNVIGLISIILSFLHNSLNSNEKSE